MHESEALVYGPGGSGTCSGGGPDLPEFVIELIVRGITVEGYKRGIERTIEAWNGTSPGHIQKLDSLKSIWSRSKSLDEVRCLVLESTSSDQRFQKSLDTTQTASFNLKLTPSQEKSRAQVPLPYTHEGQIFLVCNYRYKCRIAGKAIPSVPSTRGAIFYEPDSADDIDDDDPDEDLDI